MAGIKSHIDKIDDGNNSNIDNKIEFINNNKEKQQIKIWKQIFVRRLDRYNKNKIGKFNPIGVIKQVLAVFTHYVSPSRLKKITNDYNINVLVTAGT